MKNYYIILIFLTVTFGVVTLARADYPEHAFCKYITVKGSVEKLELKDNIDLSNRNLTQNSFHRELGELKNINFDKSRLSCSSLAETAFVNCSFREAKLYRVDAGDTFFYDCDFTDADISEATFSYLSVKNIVQTANYQKKDLSNISIQIWGFGVSLASGNGIMPPKTVERVGLDLTDFNLENAVLPCDKIGCDFTNARIAGAQLGLNKEQLMSTRDYKKGALVKITFKGVDFTGVDFSTINLTGCRFEWNGGIKAKLKSADFSDAVISECDFSQVEDLTLAQIKSTWNYKVGRMEGIKLPKDIQDALDAEKRDETEP